MISTHRDELTTVRLQRLESLTTPCIAEVVSAYTLPLIEFAQTSEEWKKYGQVWAQLVCAYSWDRKLGSLIETDAQQFIAAIRKAEPSLDEIDACWAFALMMGAVGAVCADNGRIDQLSVGKVVSSDFGMITPRLLQYVTAGIHGLAERPFNTEFHDIPVSRKRSKETRDLILDSAERMFAAHGFYGTSFRTISKSSGLSVGLCQHYFGTKEGLFAATLSRRSLPLVEERAALLMSTEAMPPGPQKLAAIYASHLEPPARKLQFGGSGWRDYTRTITTAINSQGQHWLDALDASHTEITRKTIDAAVAALPGLSFGDVCFAHLFMIGSLSVAYSAEDRLKRLSGGLIDPRDYRDAYKRLLTFHTAGTIGLATTQ